MVEYMDGREFRTQSIIGPQSSGKSTLLNALHNTSFQMMREGDDCQTTKGVFVSCNDERDIIIFDIEGSDSIERDNENGGGGDFEKKLATFGLLSSDVLLVNIESPEVIFKILKQIKIFNFY